MTQPSQQDQLNELKRVLDSPYFKGAPELTKLLGVLEEYWKDNPVKPVKEREIAERLFKDFDRDQKVRPDARVRLRILRAREALHDYYRFTPHQVGDICVWIQREAQKGNSGYHLLFESFPGQYTGLSADLVDRFWNQQIASRVVAASPDHISNAGVVNIVFSNESDPTKSRVKVPGIWAGTGEVIGVFHLAKALCKARVESELIRSSTLICGEQTAHKNRVFVYIGSSLAMSALRKLRELGRLRKKQRFFFQWGKDDSGKERGEIYDTVGREKYCCETTEEWAYTDYALISHFHDEELNHTIIGLSGISTFATEQAVRDVTDLHGIQKLYRAIGQGPDKPLPDFEVLLKVDVSQGAPTGSEVVPPGSGAGRAAAK